MLRFNGLVYKVVWFSIKRLNGSAYKGLMVQHTQDLWFSIQNVDGSVRKCLNVQHTKG